MRAVEAVTVVISMMTLVAMFHLSKSLNCYECNVNGDVYDPKCEKIDDKHRAELVTKCPDRARKCGTMVTFGLHGEKDITSRGCLDSYETHRCEELDDPSVSCEACDDDECNDVSILTD